MRKLGKGSVIEIMLQLKRSQFFLPDSARLQRREEGKGWGREEGGGLG